LKHSPINARWRWLGDFARCQFFRDALISLEQLARLFYLIKQQAGERRTLREAAIAATIDDYTQKVTTSASTSPTHPHRSEFFHAKLQRANDLMLMSLLVEELCRPKLW
jgi:hypothetical protein